MKKIFCVVFAVLMIAAVMCGCSSTVKTTVDSKYADSFAEKYADSSSVDENGNVSYEFSDEKYNEFLNDYYDEIVEDSKQIVTTDHQYTYYNEDLDDAGNSITEVIVGVKPEAYAAATEEALKAEAEEVGKSAIRYQMNTNNPTGVITVIYRNANTGEEYFRITVTAE